MRSQLEVAEMLLQAERDYYDESDVVLRVN